jgi:hypothetical protein
LTALIYWATNINSVNKTAYLLVASKETVLEANAEETTYTFTFREQNAGQNHNIKTANKSFENVTVLKYVGTTVTDRNLMHE